MKTVLILSFIVMSCSTQQTTAPTVPTKELVAVSDIHSVKYTNASGLIKIEELKDEIKVTTDLKGLKPNSKLGFHIHEKGICEGPDYKTAGNHLNPEHHDHGRPESSERHLGDMGNIVTNAEGVSKQVILLPKSSMDDVDKIIGKAILIHAKADDLKTQPTGDSGDRVACGLIKPI
jgi:Cu-Zn family superoxide dismutase